MKRIIVLLLMIAVLLSACSSASFKLDADKITSVTASSQMTDEVKTVELKDDYVLSFATLINGLGLKNKNVKDDSKGWQYLFTVHQADGKDIIIAFSEDKILIDGEVYASSVPVPEKIDTFFQ